MNEKSFDRSALDSVLALNDEQLKEAIHALAVTGGMNEKRAFAISRNTDMIRKKLASVSPEDVGRLLSQIDGEQLKQITEQFSGTIKKKE